MKYLLEFGCLAVILTEKIEPEVILKPLLHALYVHILIICIQLIFPDSRYFFYSISGFETDFPVFYRVAGLSLGYDSASVLCTITMILTLFWRSNQSVSLLVFICTLCTARTGIVLNLLVIAFFLLRKYLSKSALVKNPFRLFFIIIPFLLLIPLYITGQQEVTNNDSTIEKAIKRSFYLKNAVDSQSEVFSTFKFSDYNLFLGSGFTPYTKYNNETDMGYSQYLQGTGILGLGFTMLFYFSLLTCARNDKKNLYIILLVSIATILIGSLKGPFLLARQTSEFIFIIFFIMIQKAEYIKKKEQN